jgi:hypothetical protein
MSKRDAVDTLKGYFYQFDYSIKRLLKLNNTNDTIVVEGIEDLDINSLGDKSVTSCRMV